MKDWIDVRIAPFFVVGVICLAVLGVVSFNTIAYGGEDSSQLTSPDQIVMEDIPEEYHSYIVSNDSQRQYSSLYANEEGGGELDRDWQPYDSFRNFDFNNDTHLVELTQYPRGNVTLGQLNNAWELYYQSYSVAEQNEWFNIENAREDNYYRFDNLHYINLREYHSSDDLNPHKPESLLYRSQKVTTESGETTTENRLVGVMYLQDSFDNGEQIGGPLTVWHYHIKPTKSCPGAIETNSILDSEVPNHVRPNATPDELYPNGSEILETTYNCDVEKQHSIQMMHVWFEKRPAGPFGSHMFSKSLAPEKYDRMNKSEFINYTLDRYVDVRSETTVQNED